MWMLCWWLAPTALKVFIVYGFTNSTMSFFSTSVVVLILKHQENVSVSIWNLTRCTDGVKKQVEVVNHLWILGIFLPSTEDFRSAFNAQNSSQWFAFLKLFLDQSLQWGLQLFTPKLWRPTHVHIPITTNDLGPASRGIQYSCSCTSIPHCTLNCFILLTPSVSCA